MGNTAIAAPKSYQNIHKMETTESTNETLIRQLYEAAERQDANLFAALFSSEGYFWDVSAGKKYYGKELGLTVDLFCGFSRYAP